MTKNVNPKRFAPMFSNASLLKQDAWRGDADKISEVLNSEHSLFIGFVDGKPLMDVSFGFEIKYFSKQQLLSEFFSTSGEWQGNWVFLGTELKDNKPIIAVDMSKVGDAYLQILREQGVKPIDLRSCAMQFSTEGDNLDQAANLGAGKSLLSWHKRHEFCANCGEKTKLVSAGHRRLCIDEKCGAEHFPRTDPVVIMLILNGDKCLLGRSPNFTEGSFSALAGFVEQGETIEEAVQREVMEEVSIKTDRVRYVLSQPWPFPSSLMIGCFAETKDTEFKIDENELEAARWFSKNEIKLALSGGDNLDFTLPPDIAIANNLLKIWLYGEKK